MGTSADQLSTEQIISAIARLSLPELEQVFDHVLALQARHKATALSAAESALLARVNQGLPVALRDRIVFLRAKREEESITDAEYEELTRLTDQAEERHADPNCQLSRTGSTGRGRRCSFRMAEKGAGVDSQMKNIAQPTDAVDRASIVAFRGLKSSQSARQLILVVSAPNRHRDSFSGYFDPQEGLTSTS
jgi:hypothetical protein